MTQVANLGGVMPVRTDPSAAPGKGGKDLLGEFAGIMDKSAQDFLNQDPSGGYTADFGHADLVKGSVRNSGVRPDRRRDTYERMSQAKPRINETRAEDAGKDPALPEKMERLAGRVVDAVKKAMGVSDSEMAEAMEELGLVPMDLLSQPNLMMLLESLSGTDSLGFLLTDEKIQAALLDVGDLIADFQLENGLNRTQFDALLEELSAQIDRMTDEIKDMLGIVDGAEAYGSPEEGIAIDEAEAGTYAVSQPGEDGAVDVEGRSAQAVAENAAEEETGPFTSILRDNGYAQTPQASESMEAGEEQEGPAAGTLQPSSLPGDAGEDARAGGNALDSGSGGETNRFLRRDAAEPEQPFSFFRDTAAPAEQMQPQAPQALEAPQAQGYIEIEHLLEQLDGLARAFSNAEGTRLEMQLNPESLGRLVLTVTEKHGNVTAQIAATNEQVKEALQSQMVELRSTLQQQGIKVEAVEVTVASHEFERNLDGNAAANGNMPDGSDDGGQRGGRRRMDARELEADGLDGLPGDEERLLAQVMLDNGGTVDYTA